MHYKIAQLSLTSKQRIDVINEVYVAQPDVEKEALVGKLFILAEMESNKADGLKVINFLVDNLNQNYYQSEKILLREKTSTLKVEHIFESALAKTNKDFAKFLNVEKIKINLNKISLTVGVIYKNEIHFANIGKNKALLIYKSRAENAQNSILNRQGALRQEAAPQTSGKYKISDITRQTNDQAEINGLKFFSNVVSGQIPQSGYFILTNETLPEYLSNKQLIEIVTTLPPMSAVEQIKNTLLSINAYVSFLSIIIKNTAGEEIAEASYKIPRAASQTSVDSLISTETQTEKLLSPSGMINPGKWFGFLGKIAYKTKNKTKTLQLKDKIVLKKRLPFMTCRRLIGNVFLFIKALGRGLVIFFSNKEKAILILKSPIVRINLVARAVLQWYKNLTKRPKIALIAFLICALLLAQNLIGLNLKNKKLANEKTYNELAESIKRKQSQIEASLLYNNEENAAKLLTEMQNLINNLPQDNEEQKTQYSELMKKYVAQSDEINHISRIEPNELSNFSKLNADARPANIVLLNKTVYAADLTKKSVYSLDLNGNIATEILNNDLNFSALHSPANGADNNVYYCDNAGGLIKFDAKNKTFTALSGAQSNGCLAMEIYNGKFYILDNKKNAITKHNLTTAGLSIGEKWLKENINLNDAINIAIDGSIYLLYANGRMEKFLKGKKQEFNLETTEQKIENPAKLFISPELDYIYILEPAQNRLLIFTKSGKYLLQYKLEKLNGLKDFAVDEKNKKIYILNDASVYVFDAMDITLQNRTP